MLNDSVMLNESKLAELLLLDNMVYEFNGQIVKGLCFDSYETILLRQNSGYHVDLLLRLAEISGNYITLNTSIKYYLSKEQKTAEQLLDFTVIQQIGYLDVNFSSEEIVYSEVTRDIEYNTDFRIGGHNLLKEFSSKEGWYLYFLFEPSGELKD